MLPRAHASDAVSKIVLRHFPHFFIFHFFSFPATPLKCTESLGQVKMRNRNRSRAQRRESVNWISFKPDNNRAKQSVTHLAVAQSASIADGCPLSGFFYFSFLSFIHKTNQNFFFVCLRSENISSTGPSGSCVV